MALNDNNIIIIKNKIIIKNSIRMHFKNRMFLRAHQLDF